MSLPHHKPATYQDLDQLTGDFVAELFAGEIVTTPRPAPKHALAASALGGELTNPFQRGRGGPGGWWIIDEPELRLAGNAFVPDLAGWRKERLPAMPETAYFDLVPDWVCEILSPATARIDRVIKLPRYAEHGVKHVWLIDPLLQTLEVFALKQGQWVLLGSYAQSDRVCAAPFIEFELELAPLWGE